MAVDSGTVYLLHTEFHQVIADVDHRVPCMMTCPTNLKAIWMVMNLVASRWLD